MFIINRCFKNIWLESQMIHVALFSFQRTTLSFEACFLAFVWKLFASSDFYILSHRAELVKKFFLSFFKFFWASCKSLANQGSWAFCRCRISQRLVLWYSIQDRLSTPILKKDKKEDCPWDSLLLASSRCYPLLTRWSSSSCDNSRWGTWS